MARRYLSLISFHDAIEKMKKAAPGSGKVETVLLDVAVGRVTAEPVYARFSVPGTHVAAMDGLAVHAAETYKASEQSPHILSSAARINTGQPLPQSYDAVIMIEDVWEEDGKYLVRKPAAPWQFIRPAGEDIRTGDLILPRRHQIRAVDVGALASYGIAFLSVLSVKVGIISTGSELVPLGIAPLPEQYVESNNFFAEAYLSGMGASCTRYPLVPDDQNLIAAQLQQAVKENDLVLLSAGSSAGTTDFSEEIIKKSGKLLFHGVEIKPGKPVMMGIVDKVPVIGMPGYPVAAQTIVREFAGRLLEHWGMAPHPSYCIRAKLAQRLPSELGYHEFVHVSAGKVDGKYIVIPLSRGFGVQSALVRSNGYLHIPPSVEGLDAQQEVDVTLYEKPSQMEKVLFLIGSQSTPLDLLADQMLGQDILLRCCRTGNLGGVLALRSGTCHAAPLHLPVFEGNTLTDLLKIFKSRPLIRVVIAEEPLGLASRDGIRPEDLRKVPILNTERGTPHRIILDTLLSRNGIRDSVVKGYHVEVKNPDVIAGRIASCVADAGICSQKAAVNAGLSFSPLGIDSYELAMRPETLKDPMMSVLVSTLQSPAFKERLRQQGECGTDHTGKIIQ